MNSTFFMIAEQISEDLLVQEEVKKMEEKIKKLEEKNKRATMKIKELVGDLRQAEEDRNMYMREYHKMIREGE